MILKFFDSFLISFSFDDFLKFLFFLFVSNLYLSVLILATVKMFYVCYVL